MKKLSMYWKKDTKKQINKKGNLQKWENEIGKLKTGNESLHFDTNKNKKSKGSKRNNTRKRIYGWQDREIGLAKK